MTTIHDLLDEYAAMAPDTRTKGLLLERLTRAFLKADPHWTSRFSDVWLWQDWPDRAGRPDTGIDLVASERFGGGTVAIQCKFFAETHTMQKADIDSFFTASGKNPFTERLIVSTTEKWSRHALDALTDQQIPTYQLGVTDFARSDIAWAEYSFAKPDAAPPVHTKSLRPHQQQALEDVQDGFASSNRGKLVMACGTGKTFTSLRIAEQLAGAGGSVLFLVPSIALLSQTLKEWTAERAMPMRSFAICSDTKVGKNNEDFSVSDLEYPATTNTAALLKAVGLADVPEGLTVYFSTYQSIDVVVRAQQEGLGPFDLVVCDEAHRTAGFTRSGDDESAFLRVHDDNAIRTKRRLYMTATPKIYADSVRGQAADAAAVLYSMDDEQLFGPVFHRLGFGEAVERELLSDYRVLVLAVDEQSVSAAFQDEFATNGELNLPEAARLVGIYNGLAKRGVEGLEDSERGQAPLRRAVSFSRSIKDSEKVREMLHGYRGARDEEGDPVPGVTAPRLDVIGGREVSFHLQARHVDGTMNVLQRNNALDWLKADVPAEENVCRILTNARCLSEGVDVPALDAVIFLNSRDSQVDVVQSVGRVMRKAPGKDYGYIVLPIAVPAGITPEQALNDNTKYKVVWDVLRALRAHDERFEAKIEQIDLNGKPDPQLQAKLYADGTDSYAERPLGAESTSGTQTVALDWSALGAEWQQAVYAKIVQKVGDREYWENWTKDVAEIAVRQRTRITTLIDTADFTLRAEFEEFLGGLRDNLNPAISRADAIEMLSQHLITEPVFDALFAGSEFSDHNPVARVMQRMIDALEGNNLDAETKGLEAFYASVQRSVSGITDAASKQTIIKRLYEKFFTGAFKATSNRLGIVYTPNEIVDFLLRSANELSHEYFGRGLTDEGVHVLDPFTGTGTFIVRLLQSGLIEAKDLARKYRYELHANELVLLAYYVAAVNIEATYSGMENTDVYEPFPGIVLTDTFQSSEADDTLDLMGVFGDNNERVKRQAELPITVITGNPPYSAGQDSWNDQNQNQKYKSLDGRIAATYGAKSNAKLKNKIYNSYVRAFRWASDRVADDGIIAFVVNNGFLDGASLDGLRRSIETEFAAVYVFNLRGDSLAGGDVARREGGNLFNVREGTALILLVRCAAPLQESAVHYAEMPDAASVADKSAILRSQTLATIDWTDLRVDSHGDWRDKRTDQFALFSALSGRDAILRRSTLGAATNRDSWVYGFSQPGVRRRVSESIDFYNSELRRIATEGGVLRREPTQIKWSRKLERLALDGKPVNYFDGRLVCATYRPFTNEVLYTSTDYTESPGAVSVFPPGADDVGFYTVGVNSEVPFSVLMVRNVPDLHLTGAGSGGQFFPRFSLLGGALEDNVSVPGPLHTESDYAGSVDSDDIFFFVYGLLHSPDYRAEFAADLKKMLPRIPDLEDAADFWAFSRAGRELSDLHLGYESIAPWPLEIRGDVPPDLYVQKMKYGGKPGAWDKSLVKVTDSLTIAGIPLEAQEYKLGSRSALDWILERYQVKTDKASGIVNDPNDWGREHGEPLYILNLVQRIIRVSMETVRIVDALPPLRYVVPVASPEGAPES